MTYKEGLSEEDYKLAEEVIKPIFIKAMRYDDSLAKYGVDCYLAGLKAGRTKWHKVADGDLPKNTDSVLNELGQLVYYVAEENKWYDDYVLVKIERYPVYWTEIPTYKE